MQAFIRDLKFKIDEFRDIQENKVQKAIQVRANFNDKFVPYFNKTHHTFIDGK